MPQCLTAVQLSHGDVGKCCKRLKLSIPIMSSAWTLFDKSCMKFQILFCLKTFTVWELKKMCVQWDQGLHFCNWGRSPGCNSVFTIKRLKGGLPVHLLTWMTKSDGSRQKHIYIIISESSWFFSICVAKICFTKKKGFCAFLQLLWNVYSLNL